MRLAYCVLRTTGSWCYFVFLRKLTSDDSRFKNVTFNDHLSILVSTKTQYAEIGDSRNGTGKSSMVNLLRYLLGGSARGALSRSELQGVTFFLEIGHQSSDIMVCRTLGPGKSVTLTSSDPDLGSISTVNKWQAWQGKHFFGLPDGVKHPSVGDLWAQFVRTEFAKATKTHPSQRKWHTGARMGYLLGLDTQAIAAGGEVAESVQVRKQLRAVMKKGDVGGLPAEPSRLRPELAEAKRMRDAAAQQLTGYRVDEQYAQHQEEADRLSSAIKELNDVVIALEARRADIVRTLNDEDGRYLDDPQLLARMEAAYREIAGTWPGSATNRFEQVEAFHKSIIRNRTLRLAAERDGLTARIEEAARRRERLDEKRAELLRLLEQSQALDTFLEAQRALAVLNEKVAALEERLTLAVQLSEEEASFGLAKINAKHSLALSIRQSRALEDAISRYGQIIQEIYRRRSGHLIVDSTSSGEVDVDVTISGDDSAGINSVKIFVLDVVLLLSAMSIGRAPGLLVHDSHLFDAMDDRQAASCLNIGARLAEENGFQYVVTMNSDKLNSITQEGRFDAAPYMIDPHLTDTVDDGGLFGFKFS